MKYVMHTGQLIYAPSNQLFGDFEETGRYDD